MTTTLIISNDLETALINHIMRNIRYEPRPDVYVALYTSDPGETGGGTEVSITGPGGGLSGYARTLCQDFSISGDTASSPEGGVRFPLALSNWGDITHMGIVNDIGILLFYGQLDEPQTVFTDNTICVYPQISLIGDSNGGWGSASITEQILKFILNNEDFSTPGNSLYVALGRSMFLTENYNYESWIEIPSSGYSRKNVQPSQWSSPSDGVVTNTAEISFTTAAPTNWGTVSHAAIFNSSTSGEMLLWGLLDPYRMMLTGDGLRFKAGALSVGIA